MPDSATLVRRSERHVPFGAVGRSVRSSFSLVACGNSARMKKPVVSPACCVLATDAFLADQLERCGAYFLSTELFYQELWMQRLCHLGFRVLSVRKEPHHHLWDIRLRAGPMEQHNLTSQVVSQGPARPGGSMSRALERDIDRMAREMGLPIERNCLRAFRRGSYIQVVFLWPRGTPGSLHSPRRSVSKFAALIKPWLRLVRN